MTALWTIIHKEILHILRDPRSLMASLALPLFMLLLFGYAISFDVREIGVAVLDEDHTEASRDLIASLGADGAVRVVRYVENEAQLDDLLNKGQARMGLQIPPHYGRDLAAGHDVPVQLLVDGTDATFAGQALSRVAGSLSTTTQRHILSALRTQGATRELPGLVAAPRVLFNEPLNGTWFVIPGLIAVIVSMLAALVTSQCIAREYEQGTIEQILVSPLAGSTLMMGKLIPYVGLGVLQVVSVVFASRFLFNVPIRGSLVLLAASTLLYLFGSMAFGLMISAVLKNQQLALQVALLASMLPSLLLSGFAYPIQNMPGWLQLITYAVPARYFITIARGLFLKGVGIEALWPELLAMWVYAVVLVVIATSRFKRSLA